MRKSILALPAVAAMLMFGATGAAVASPAAKPDNVVGSLYTTNGTAGWYTNSFANTFKQVDGTFTLNPENVANYGGVGIQLCTSTNGHAAQVGAVPLGPGSGLWAVGYWRGFLFGNPTGDNDPCNGGFFGFTGSGGFTQLGIVKAGTTVQAEIKQTRGGLLFSVADGPLVSFTYFLPSFPGFFNEAAAGTSFNLNILSAPATNDLVDFTNVSAMNSAGVEHGFAYWNAVSVSSSKDGIPPPLLTVSLLNPSTAVRTWHPGHRYYYGKPGHRRYRWIKGYWTGSGLGPSSFSLLGGTPVGF
jgi:hypothetical protein